MSESKYQLPLIQSSRFSFGKNDKNDKQYTFHEHNLKSQSSHSEDIQLQVFRTIQNSSLKRKVYKLFNALKNHCGRHHAIMYRPQFGFSQYWQDKKYKFEEYNNLQYFQYPHWLYYLFAFFILTSKLGIMWMISIHRLFGMGNDNIAQVLVWIFGTLFLDAILKYQLFVHYDYFKEKEIIKYVKSYWREILLIGYFITCPFHFGFHRQILLLPDIFAVVLLYKRCQQLMTCLRLEITSSSYKNLFDLVELFTMLLPLAHLFSLILYFVAQCNQQKNWLIANNLNELPPIEKYVYSLYFTLTTMLTVGYGDISPVSIPQIIVIMFVQLFGIATYGYIINSIGNIINYMKMEDQILSRDISTMSKMAKYYDIDKTLVQKAKNFLVFQKKQRAALTPEQEEMTLRKLHDDLRQQISQQNALKIVKSSLFYVCNWTKRFQIEIAKKLHKKIFTPNQEILQIPGKQRLYVFKKGKVEIHANRISGYKKHFKKILRTIEPNETMEVSDNIYGYTFLLSNTPIKLTAINKEFVVAYFVEKKDFLETVMDNHLDREYFFEMKTKIDSMSYPESWEAPLIINTKEHYFPNIQYLIMKNKQFSHKHKNVRSSKIDLRRYRNRTKRVYYRNFEEMQGGQCLPNVLEVINEYVTSQKDPYINRTDKVLSTSKTEENMFYSSTTWMSNSLMNDYNQFKKQNLHYLLEQSRQYCNYFKKFNRTDVLMKLDNSNYMTKNQKLKKTQQLRKSTIYLHRKKTTKKNINNI